MSPARPPAKLCTRCPYCEHVSPDNSKFCNACGAALHLRPCPHCGAVNDLTLVDHCARCHGALQPVTADDPLPEAPPPTKPRPAWPIGGGLVLMACVAAAGYLVYAPQRPAPTAPPAVVVSDALIAMPPAEPASDPVEIQATALASTVPDEAPAPKPRQRPAEPAEARPPPPARAIEPPPPRIGPCTEAVAALGLCHGASAPHPQRP